MNLPKEILSEALEILKSNFPTWLIPKIEYISHHNDESEIFEQEVDDWESFCYLNEKGDYVCPVRFEYSKNEDQEIIPIGENIVFDNLTILHEGIKLAKEEYPEVFSKLNNL